MRHIFERIMKLSSDDAFLGFQHDLTKRIYDALGQGYAKNDNEVALIQRTVEAINGQTYKGITVFSTVIHGPRSYVQFNFMDKPVTKELGDMTVATVITDGNQRLLQKVCIIQNKKEREGRWAIDEEQLYLLKNFPPISGDKGLFRHVHNLSFRNSSGCLGCYGLFHTPGEMIMTSASVLTELLKGKKSLPHSEISLLPSKDTFGGAGYNSSMSWLSPFFWHRHPKDIFMFFEEMVMNYGYPVLAGIPMNGFMGSVPFSRDTYDFVKNWTQLNLGETTAVFGNIVNANADAFANFIIRSAGFADLDIDLPPNSVFEGNIFEGQMGVLLLHYDISK